MEGVVRQQFPATNEQSNTLPCGCCAGASCGSVCRKCLERMGCPARQPSKNRLRRNNLSIKYARTIEKGRHMNHTVRMSRHPVFAGRLGGVAATFRRRGTGSRRSEGCVRAATVPAALDCALRLPPRPCMRWRRLANPRPVPEAGLLITSHEVQQCLIDDME